MISDPVKQLRESLKTAEALTALLRNLGVEPDPQAVEGMAMLRKIVDMPPDQLEALFGSNHNRLN